MTPDVDLNMLESDYFDWLCALAGTDGDEMLGNGYRMLSKRLHEKEFYWILPRDDNRAVDGVDLRLRFLDERPDYAEIDIKKRKKKHFLERYCSVFEMLIGLCWRLTDEVIYGSPNKRIISKLFMDILYRTELYEMMDNVFDEEMAALLEIKINKILDRKYDKDGDGSFFGVCRKKKRGQLGDFGDVYGRKICDKTKLEIWNQALEWIETENWLK